MRFMAVDPHSKGLFTRVTLPLAVFGLINQAARTVMAVIGPVLAVEFALSASELGLLAACMLAAYAVAQLPGGMALDRVGARNVQAALAPGHGRGIRALRARRELRDPGRRAHDRRRRHLRRT